MLCKAGAFTTVHYVPRSPISNGTHDAFGGRVRIWKGGKSKEKVIANVIPRVGGMITSNSGICTRHLGKRRLANIAAYMLAFGDRFFPQWRWVMSSK